MNRSFRLALVVVGVATVTSCCTKFVEPIGEKVLWEGSLSLSIKNSMAQAFEILPVGDGGGVGKKVEPGETVEIDFQARRVIEVDPESGEVKPGSERNEVAPPSPYLEMESIDGALKIKFAGRPERKLQVRLCESWFQDPPGEEGRWIEFTRVPPAGRPINRCP